MSEELSKAELRKEVVELYKKGQEGFRLYQQLTLAFRVLTLDACRHSSRCQRLYRNPLAGIEHTVSNWLESDSDLFHVPHLPIELKAQLFEAFEKLSIDQSRFPFSDSDPMHCPVCGSQLVTAYNEPLVCERCMQPVLDALDELVRATTTLWTPEDLREAYLNALNSVDETA